MKGLITFLLVLCCTVPIFGQNMKAISGPNGVTLTWQPANTPSNAPVIAIRAYRGFSLEREGLITVNPVLVANLTCPVGFPAGNQCYTDKTASGMVYYQVTSINANGESVRSNELMVIVGAPTPPAPVNLTGVFVKDPAILLTWSTPTDVTLFNVYRDISGTSNYVKINISPISCTQNVCSYYDNAIAPNTFYNYMVTSFIPGAGESAFSNKLFAPYTQ